MSVLQRMNVHLAGAGPSAMVFAHGFGCDQNMWRFVEPAFRERHRTVLFDNVGAGAVGSSGLLPTNMHRWTATPTICLSSDALWS